jgi:hypothetical protein
MSAYDDTLGYMKLTCNSRPSVIPNKCRCGSVTVLIISTCSSAFAPYPRTVKLTVISLPSSPVIPCMITSIGFLQNGARGINTSR